MDEDHLLKKFSKPHEGEYVPITFVEFKRELVGWSPELKRSVYIEKDEDISKLKRIREINIMIVINHLSEKLSSIELTDEEKEQFEMIYDVFLKNGGQLLYTRKKSGAKSSPFFELREPGKKVREKPEKNLLSDML